MADCEQEFCAAAGFSRTDACAAPRPRRPYAAYQIGQQNLGITLLKTAGTILQFTGKLWALLTRAQSLGGARRGGPRSPISTSSSLFSCYGGDWTSRAKRSMSRTSTS